MIIPDPDSHEKKSKNRQLKCYPESQNHAKEESEILTDPNRRIDAHGFVLLDKILKRDGQNDSVTKISAAEKKQRRAKNKGQNPSLFPSRQPGRDEAPYLVKDDRTRKQNARRQGDFDLEEERFGDAGADQTLAGLQVLPERGYHEGKNRIRKIVTDTCRYRDRQNRLQQTPAELFEVLRQRHVRIARHSPRPHSEIAKKGKV